MSNKLSPGRQTTPVTLVVLIIKPYKRSLRKQVSRLTLIIININYILAHAFYIITKRERCTIEVFSMFFYELEKLIID